MLGSEPSQMDSDRRLFWTDWEMLVDAASALLCCDLVYFCFLATYGVILTLGRLRQERVRDSLVYRERHCLSFSCCLLLRTMFLLREWASILEGVSFNQNLCLSSAHALYMTEGRQWVPLINWLVIWRIFPAGLECRCLCHVGDRPDTWPTPGFSYFIF